MRTPRIAAAIAVLLLATGTSYAKTHQQQQYVGQYTYTYNNPNPPFLFGYPPQQSPRQIAPHQSKTRVAHKRHKRHHHVVAAKHRSHTVVENKKTGPAETIPVARAEKSYGDGTVRVATLAGPIRVMASLKDKFVGFINALVTERHYHPKHIGCWAPVGTHVPHSNHYSGAACDIDQTGWSKTASTMYHIGALASRFGLRDGCTFRHPRPDCGHVDVPQHTMYASYRSHHRQRMKVARQI